MMIYNMDYLLAALIFLCILFGHYCSRKRVRSINGTVFFFLSLIGIVDIIFDFITSALIMMDDPSLVMVTRLSLTMFYLMQDAFPYMLMCYINSLRDIDRTRMKKSIRMWSVPAIAMGILILANMVTESLFGFDSTGHYFRGKLYYGMYLYVFIFCILVVIEIIHRHKELGRKRVLIMWEVMITSGTCVLMQALIPTTLMTGLGITLGVLILFLNINNPSEYTDSLTGIFGREIFDQWISEMLQSKQEIFLLMIDIPGIRQINKIYGARTGDKVLLLIAENAEKQQPEGLVFRVEGNTFVMVSTSKKEHDKAEKFMCDLLMEPLDINGEKIHCRCTLCSVEQAQNLGTSDKMYACLEYLVHQERDNKETVFIECDEKSFAGFWYSQEVERFLGEAIEKDLFEVHYQPIYDVKTEKPICLEALSRLEHPKFGSLSPDLFISIAEKNGQIIELSELQFRKICRFVKENEEIMTTIRNIKYNLSPLELMRSGYGEYLVRTIREFRLKESYFQFEITETVATEYSDALKQAVKVLLDAGIGLSLDDFGSGYANLNTVLKLPFANIKMDKTLLNGICDDEQIASFYKNVAEILQHMGYLIVSEGVEEKREVELLRSWGIDMIQGYYYSKPLPERKLLELLKSQ